MAEILRKYDVLKDTKNDKKLLKRKPSKKEHFKPRGLKDQRPAKIQSKVSRTIATNVMTGYLLEMSSAKSSNNRKCQLGY